MSTLDTNNLNPFDEGQVKNKQFKSQLKTIFHYLRENVATTSMVSDATGIPQKNITRFKRDLEEQGELLVEKKNCEKTGFKAWHLTTNSDLFPSSNQLNLF